MTTTTSTFTTTSTSIPTGKSVTAKFNRIDTADNKRIVDTGTDGVTLIRKDSAWYGVGLIMFDLRDKVAADGGMRITTKMLKDAAIAGIDRFRRRDGEKLVSLESELNEFINSDDAPKSITNVTKLLADYAAFQKASSDDDSDDSDDSDDDSETETDDDAAPMTAAEIAAQALTTAKAHGVDPKQLVLAIVEQSTATATTTRRAA